jgi:phage replication initiation protein
MLMSDDEKLVGGGSNTPLLSAYTEKRVLEKRVLIDFLSVTFDFVEVYALNSKIYRLVNETKEFEKLLKLLGFTDDYTKLPKIQPIRGYSECYGIGENIKLLFGGEHTKNANGKYSMNLLMSGQACREFENYLDGNWNRLLSFLLQKGAAIKRIDIAIDDFDGQEIDIYEIEGILRSRNFVSPFRKINYQFTDSYVGDLVVSEGYTITMGSAGSNQLQIYDKRLERDAKNQPDLSTDIWYRYEMRFVNEKADSVAQMYAVAIFENNSKGFMKYARELLFNCLDLKVQQISNAQRTRWETHEKWNAFLDSVEKIDLNVKHKVETTIDKRMKWYDRSIKRINASFYASLSADRDFMSFIVNNVLEGFESFEEKDITITNNYRVSKGQKKLTWQDIIAIKNNLKEFIGEKNDKEELSS